MHCGQLTFERAHLIFALLHLPLHHPAAPLGGVKRPVGRVELRTHRHALAAQSVRLAHRTGSLGMQRGELLHARRQLRLQVAAACSSRGLSRRSALGL